MAGRKKFIVKMSQAQGRVIQTVAGELNVSPEEFLKRAAFYVISEGRRRHDDIQKNKEVETTEEKQAEEKKD